MEFHGAACGQAMEAMAGRQVFLPQLATYDCGSSWSGLTGALTAAIGGTSWCLRLVSGALQRRWHEQQRRFPSRRPAALHEAHLQVWQQQQEAGVP